MEESHLSARQTPLKLGIPRTKPYRRHDRYLQRGDASLQDHFREPKNIWNRMPAEVKRKVVKLALKETELSPHELAVTFGRCGDSTVRMNSHSSYLRHQIPRTPYPRTCFLIK